jgi:hypothetical protein
MSGFDPAVLVRRARGAHLRDVGGAPHPPRHPARTAIQDRPGPRPEGSQAVDPATAKTLVSAVLVACIALFSAVSFQALFAQIVADLRGVRTERAMVRVPVRAHRPRRRAE